MNKISITLGTCWFNEDAITIIDFFKKLSMILKESNIEVNLILFDARYNHNKKDLDKIKNEIKDIKIILNKTNIFPNKNYGISLITKESNTEYIAVIDPDWQIKDYKLFIKNLINGLEKNDILIPNIKEASGRSNILIGYTAVTLFFPEYKEILKSPFPGALVAKREKLLEIVNDKKYNFDWGGEWDIIALAIEKQMKISSVEVDVIGIRHRTNKSKMNDSFQIWKSILSNKYVIKRINKRIDDFSEFKNINLYKKLKNANEINEMIDILETKKFSKTEKQFLYMVIYPLAVFYNKIDNIEKVPEFNGLPYDKKELFNISNCIIYLTKKIILKEYLNKNNKEIISQYYSKWNKKNMNEALNNYEVIQ